MAGRSISSRLTIWFSSVYFAGLALFGIAMWFNLGAHSHPNAVPNSWSGARTG